MWHQAAGVGSAAFEVRRHAAFVITKGTLHAEKNKGWGRACALRDWAEWCQPCWLINLLKGGAAGFSVGGKVLGGAREQKVKLQILPLLLIPNWNRKRATTTSAVPK